MKATVIMHALPNAAKVKICDMKNGRVIYEGRAGDAPAYAFSNVLTTYLFFDYTNEHIMYVDLSERTIEAWEKAQSRDA